MPLATGNEDVAIFWDYENCPAPSSYTGYDLVDAIRRMAQQFGSVKLFKAYLEVSEQVLNSRSLNLRSELQVSGVSLTDCPHNGRKDAADKMMLVDMLAHAIDHPAPSTILLISGDRDFAYALSTLRLRRYKVVLVTLPNAHISLRAQATTCLDWFFDVVDTIPARPSSPKKVKAFTVNIESGGRKTDSNNSGNKFPAHNEENGNVPTKKSSIYSEWGMDTDAVFSSPLKSPRKMGAQPLSLSQDWEQSQRQTFQPPTRPPIHAQNGRSDSTSRILSPPPPTGQSETTLRAIQHQPRFPVSEQDVLDDTPVGAFRLASQIPGDDPSDSTDDPVISTSTSPSNLPVDCDDAMSTNESTRSESQQTNDTNDVEVPTVVPDPFKALVRQLQWYHTRGNYIVLRSTLGVDLGTRFQNVYKRAGVKKFTEYVVMAEKSGIVELGGTGGEAWIRLCSGWEKASTRW